MSLDLFKDIAPSILQTKKDLFIEEGSIKEYNPYMVNKALSNYVDCVMYVNNMNMNSELHPRAQYDYLINSIRASKRPYAKWYKQPERQEDLDAVKLFFGYSDRKARETIKLLTEEQINIIKIKTTIGD
jgi:hypothetical protein